MRIKRILGLSVALLVALIVTATTLTYIYLSVGGGGAVMSSNQISLQQSFQILISIVFFYYMAKKAGDKPYLEALMVAFVAKLLGTVLTYLLLSQPVYFLVWIQDFVLLVLAALAGTKLSLSRRAVT